MRYDFVAIGILSFVVLIVVILGFGQVGGPWKIRGEKFDSARIADIRGLKLRVEDYYYKYGKLPETINDAVASSTAVKKDFKDPQTGKDYAYTHTGALGYQLCATFTTDTTVDKKDKEQSSYSYYDEEFKHAKGDFCFDLNVQSRVRYPNTYASPSPTTFDGGAYGVGGGDQRIAQVFRPQSDRTVNNITVNMYAKDDDGSEALIQLRELTSPDDIDGGSLLSVARTAVSKGNFDSKLKVSFEKPVVLKKGATYALVFDLGGSNRKGYMVSHSENSIDPAEEAYWFGGTNLVKPSWTKRPDDLIYSLQ